MQIALSFLCDGYVNHYKWYKLIIVIYGIYIPPSSPFRNNLIHSKKFPYEEAAAFICRCGYDHYRYYRRIEY